MGEAKARQRVRKSATQKLITEHPFCCFCGGLVPTASTDHRPPITLFPNQRRPKGLEFPSCIACNGDASPDDAVLALAGRLCGSSSRPDMNDPDLHFDRVVKAVESGFPSLISQLMVENVWVVANGILRRVGQFRIDSPLLSESLCRSGARLAVALYYEEFGRAVSVGSIVNSYWSHNQTRDLNKVQRLISRLPKDAVLKQGQKWDTEGVFFARYNSDEKRYVMIAVLYRTLILFATVQRYRSGGHSKWPYTWTIEEGKGLVQKQPA